MQSSSSQHICKTPVLSVWQGCSFALIALQAMPFSLPNGTSSQPIFDRPTPPASSSVQAQPPTDHRPSFPAKNPPPTTRLSAAAPPFSLNPSYATLPRSSQPAQEPVASGLASTAPTPAPMFQRPVFAAPAPVFEAPATAPAAPQSLPTAPRSAPTSDTPVFTAPASVPEAPIPAYDAPRSVTPGPTSVSLASTGIHEAPRSSTVTPAPLSVAPPATPVAPSEAIRSPASHVSEEFTDDDMSSTAEEIGAQRKHHCCS